MDWWTAVGQWVLNKLDTADWVDVLASLISIFVAVWLALWLQRRDFDRRTGEAKEEFDRQSALQAAEFSHRRDEYERLIESGHAMRHAEWRVSVASRAYDIVNLAARYCSDPYEKGGVTEAEIRESIYSVQMLFDMQRGARPVGDWFRRVALELAFPPVEPDSRVEFAKGVGAKVRSELSQWASGKILDDAFHSK